MDLNLDKADIQWKFLIGCLIRRELEKDTIDRLSMSLFNMNLLDFAVVSQNYPLCKVISTDSNFTIQKLKCHLKSLQSTQCPRTDLSKRF